MLVDGSPGIGCPVISSLSGANLVIIVTEPTISGFHDMKRVAELVKKFKIKTACIINKFDINPEITEEIDQYLERENIELISYLPYDEAFTKAMIVGKTVAVYDEKLKHLLLLSWKKIESILN